MNPTFITNLIKNELLSKLHKFINTIYTKNTIDIIIHTTPTNLEKLLSFLALSTLHNIRTLNEILAVDFPYNKKNRFQCIYILSSLKFSNRILITVDYDEKNIYNSITNIFTCAEWYEREIWDLYGLWFKNHPNLRRILNDYGYRDHPFKKDYPLNGYIQVQYNSLLNSIIIHKLTSLQEFRVWDFQSPWVCETTLKNMKIKDTFNLDILDTINQEEEVMEEHEKTTLSTYTEYIKEVENVYEEDMWELTVFTN